MVNLPLAPASPHGQAMGQLILLALHTTDGGMLSSESGRVPTLLRELCDIPTVPSATALMSEVIIALEDGGFVQRIKRGKGTRQIELCQPLKDDFVKDLERHEAANRQLMRGFIDWEREHLSETVADFVKDCQKALQRVRQTVADPRVLRGEPGEYVINMTETIKSAGLRPQRATEVRTALKELGLIDSLRQHVSNNWWWRIDTTTPLDAAKAAENAAANIEMAIQRVLIATTSTPESVDATTTIVSTTASTVAAEPVQPAAKGRLGQLLEIIERLNKAKAALDNRNGELIRENQQLTTQNRELRGENQRLTEENNTLHTENQQLQEKIRQYDEEMGLADEVLRRFSGDSMD